MKVFEINHSTRNAFKTCPRKVYWREVAGVEPAQTPKALAIGSAFHAGLEAWRRDGDTMNAQDVAVCYLRDSGALSGEALRVEQAKVLAYLAGYFVVYAGDRAGLKDWVVEKRHLDPAKAEHGTLDARYPLPDGRWVIVDDKTTSALEPGREASLALNEQMLNYCLLARASGLEVAYVLYREVHKSQMRPKLSEDDYAFSERVMAAYLAPDAGRLYRQLKVTYSPAQLDAYAHHKLLVDNALRSQLHQTRLEAWPWNGSGCLGTYGACDYLSLCSGAPNVAAAFKPREEPLDHGEFQRTLWPSRSAAPGPAGRRPAPAPGPGPAGEPGRPVAARPAPGRAAPEAYDDSTDWPAGRGPNNVSGPSAADQAAVDAADPRPKGRARRKAKAPKPDSHKARALSQGESDAILGLGKRASDDGF